MKKAQIKTNFIDKFDFSNKEGFFQKTAYKDENEIGFSVKKTFGDKKEKKVSLFSFFLDYEKLDDTKVPLFISASFGLDEGDHIKKEFSFKSSDPIDISSYDEYCYDIETENFLKKGEIVSTDIIVENIKSGHLKTTKLFKGFYLRIKVILFRRIFPRIFLVISNIVSDLLFWISRDRYRYNSLAQQTELKTDRFRARSNLEDRRGERKVEIFGYKASARIVCFYAVFHLLVYAVCFCLDYRPLIMKELLRNNFLTIMYAVTTLGFFDALLPLILRKTVGISGKISFYFLYKKIEI